jgi:hypothetical protein
MGNTKKKKQTKPQPSGHQARQKPDAPKGNSPAKMALRAMRRSSQIPDPALTKSDRILSLLKQPSGTTLKHIVEITGWQAHSVRGFISGHVVKKMGLRVKSFRRDGERVYVIKSYFPGG